MASNHLKTRQTISRPDDFEPFDTQTCPVLGSSLNFVCFLSSINLLDLDMLSKLITTGTNRLFDLPGSSHHKGLSGLAHKLLGKPLDKRDQISDWTRRPLTKEQVQSPPDFWLHFPGFEQFLPGTKQS